MNDGLPPFSDWCYCDTCKSCGYKQQHEGHEIWQTKLKGKNYHESAAMAEFGNIL